MVILGCGGAARSIIAEALLRNTGKVTIVCRGINEDMSSESGQNEENSQKAPSNLELTLKMLSRIKSSNTETVFVDSDDHEGIQAAIDEAEVLINSTPLGMADGHGNEIRLPIPENIVFDKRLIVADCVYNPDETLLIKKALSSGCRTIKGIKMLEEQARCGVDILLGRY
jgi:shikimate dehydrogenase